MGVPYSPSPVGRSGGPHRLFPFIMYVCMYVCRLWCMLTKVAGQELKSQKQIQHKFKINPSSLHTFSELVLDSLIPLRAHSFTHAYMLTEPWEQGQGEPSHILRTPAAFQREAETRPVPGLPPGPARARSLLRLLVRQRWGPGPASPRRWHLTRSERWCTDELNR